MQELYNPVTGMHMHSLNTYIFCSIVRVYSPLNPQLHPAAAASSRVLFGRRWRRADVQLTLYCKDGERKERGLGSALFSACVVPVALIYTAPPPCANTHSIIWFVNSVQHERGQSVNRERKSNWDGQRRGGVTGNRYECNAAASPSSPRCNSSSLLPVGTISSRLIKQLSLMVFYIYVFLFFLKGPRGAFHCNTWLVALEPEETHRSSF